MLSCTQRLLMKTQSIRQLLQLCLSARHDSRSWERLVDTIYPLANRIAARVATQWGVGIREEIEDLTQEICVKITQRSSAFVSTLPEDDAEATKYLAVLAANTARDSMRARFANKRGERSTRPLLQEHEPAGERGLSLGMDREILLRQLDAMVEGSEMERAVFRLYYQQGFTAKEISSIPAIGLTMKGVESMIHRIVASLRSKIALASPSRPEGLESMDLHS